MGKETARGHLAALFTVVNWGTTFIATKLLLEAFSPIEILLFRFVLGFAALWLVCPRQLKVGNWRREAVFAAAGLTGVCLYYLLENIALTFSPASNVGVIVSASPLFAALLTMAASGGRERPRRSFLAGFGVSMAGICLISFQGTQLSLDPRGDLLALGAAVVWAGYSLLTKKIGGWGWNVLQTTRRTFGWGILFMIPAAVGMDFHLGLERLADPGRAGMLLYLGLGACAACFVTWNFAIRALGPVRTMVYLYLVPVITVVCSVGILHEAVTPLSAAGMGMTLAGLAASQWESLGQLRPRREELPQGEGQPEEPLEPLHK